MKEQKKRICIACSKCTTPCELLLILKFFLEDVASIIKYGRENNWNNTNELNQLVSESIKENQMLADNAATPSTLRFSVTEIQPFEEGGVYPISMLIEKGIIKINESRGNTPFFFKDSKVETLFDPSS